jgi:hypothetical protein
MPVILALWRLRQEFEANLNAKKTKKSKNPSRGTNEETEWVYL